MASITIDEAARYLNVSTRTISNYISQGIITYHKRQGSNRKYIDSSSLHDLKEAKEQDDFSVKRFKELVVKVKRLEAQLEVVLKILDTKQVPLGINEDSGKELFNTALATSDTTLSVDHVEAWLPILMSIDEYDLENIQKGTKSDKPWLPFLELAIGMIVFISGNKDYEINLNMQLLHKELMEARRRLRLSALLYIEKDGPKREVDSLIHSKPETIVDTLKKWAKVGINK